MGYLCRDDDECQPCDAYEPHESRPYDVHQCMRCGGTVYHCGHCLGDHHENGWQTCKVTDVMRKCGHPLCKAKVDAADRAEQDVRIAAAAREYVEAERAAHDPNATIAQLDRQIAAKLALVAAVEGKP